MKTCQTCSAYLHPECSIYNRIPPEGFAEKCKHYLFDERKPDLDESPTTKADCNGCEHNDHGWCLRLDHPEWKWNYVKIREGIKCQKMGE